MNTQKKPDGLVASLSRKNQKSGVLSSLRIVRSSAKVTAYAFPKPKLVPAGKYRSKIIDIIESKTKQGEDAIDVHYDFTNGNILYRAKMRYPLDSSHFGALCDALLAAGVPENANIRKGIGVEEDIELAYPNGATIGSIVGRSPVVASDDEMADEDDELYDMLEDDEDLD